MSGLFGSSKSPAPAPLPPSPSDSAEAEAKRLEAERAAIAQRKAAGRSSTIVGGMGIKEEENPLAPKVAKKREAARVLGG
jgi:hypothetical protein